MQARRPSLPAKLKYPPIKIEKPDSKQASPAHTRPKSRTPILDSSDSDSSEMIQRKVSFFTKFDLSLNFDYNWNFEKNFPEFLSILDFKI